MGSVTAWARRSLGLLAYREERLRMKTTPSPAEPQRGAALLLLAMAVTAVVMLVTMSPFSKPVDDKRAFPVQANASSPWPSEQGSDSEIVLVNPGDEQKVTLEYHLGETLPTFGLSLSQTMRLEAKGLETEVTTTLSVTVIQEPTKEEDSVYVSFSDFSLSVVSDGDDVALPAVNSLLAGLKLSVTVHPTLGIQQDEAIGAMNPQVRRMMSLLLDTYRQAYVPLPNQSVGKDANWTRERTWEGSSGLDSLAKESVTLEALGAQSATIVQRTHLEIGGEADDEDLSGRGEGTVRAELDLENGTLRRSEGTFSLTQTLGEAAQTLELEFLLQRR